jgi:radical SAM/Cys-rich protein
MRATLPLLQDTDFPEINRYKLETLQVNLGYRCNQTCFHCHVAAGPNRKENMTFDTVRQIIDVLRSASIRTLDLTGGAPELNPNFRHLVSTARDLGIHVMDRCNLTVLEQPGQEDLADFLAGHRVEVVASLPCYTEDNVDAQRGDGVFEGSIRGLKQLNALGYGKADSGLLLNLVYNPLGAFLPPPQEALQADYKQHLGDNFGIEFNNLFTLANMPIQRFGSTLIKEGKFEAYMELLKNAYRPENLENVMCRNLLSVDWQGYVFDCDFNQMLKLPLQWQGRPRTHIRDLIDVDLRANPIMIADHCYGCTAGQGSSCGGALA